MSRDRRNTDKPPHQFLDNLPMGSVIFDEELLDTMRKSIHPPHLIDKDKIIPNAAFPFCKYDGDSEGTLLPEYGDRYCNAFQVGDNFFDCYQQSSHPSINPSTHNVVTLVLYILNSGLCQWLVRNVLNNKIINNQVGGRG